MPSEGCAFSKHYPPPSCGIKHLRSVRSVSAKQVGYQTSSADGSCELAGAPPSAGWHPLQAYRPIVDLASVVAMSLFQSCRSAIHPKVLRARLLRGPPSKRHPLDLASRRLSPYRSRASPRRKLPGIRHTIIRYRAQSQADHNSFTAIALCICHEQSETLQKLAPKSKDLQSLSLPAARAAIRLSRTRL